MYLQNFLNSLDKPNYVGNIIREGGRGRGEGSQ